MDYQQALDLVDEKYRIFLMNFERFNKKLGRTVSNAYITVDGRIQMATDECTREGQLLQIETSFEEVFGKPMAKATVRTNRGTSSAHAEVFFDATIGPDSTNPLSCAETSAVGRALGFLGFNLFGGGIASAEEVERALDKQGEAESSPEVKTEKPKAIGVKPATEKQISYLGFLLRKQGKDEAFIEAEINRVSHSFKLASDVINSLANPSQELEAGRKRKFFWASARAEMRKSGKTENDLRSFILREYDKEHTADLSDAEIDATLEWLGEPEEDIPDLRIEDMPVSLKSVFELCKTEGIDWRQMEGYLESAHQVEDIETLPRETIKRVMNSFAMDQKGRFVHEVKSWKKPTTDNESETLPLA